MQTYRNPWRNTYKHFGCIHWSLVEVHPYLLASAQSWLVCVPSTCWPLCRTPQPCCWLCSAGCSSSLSHSALLRRSPWKNCLVCGLKVYECGHLCVGGEGWRRIRKVKKNPPTPRKGKKTKSFIANERKRRKTEKVIYILLCLSLLDDYLCEYYKWLLQSQLLLAEITMGWPIWGNFNTLKFFFSCKFKERYTVKTNFILNL